MLKRSQNPVGIWTCLLPPTPEPFGIISGPFKRVLEASTTGKLQQLAWSAATEVSTFVQGAMGAKAYDLSASIKSSVPGTKHTPW